MTASKDIPGVEVGRGRVLPGWIGLNKHMNVAYYVLAFDHAVDELWDRFGITGDHIREMNSSTFAVESHVIYRREMTLDDPHLVTAQILADIRKVAESQGEWEWPGDAGRQMRIASPLYSMAGGSGR